jgi:hypothetical protein
MTRYTRRFTPAFKKPEKHFLLSPTPLTDEQLLEHVPSVMAVDKHAERSAGYTFISTGQVITALRKEGFQPFMAAQSLPKDKSRLNFARHMVRFRHEDNIGAEETNEIILLNSHDGTSSYQMTAGVFRKVCANGLIAGDVVDSLRIPHRGNIIDNIIEGSYRILSNFDQVDAHRDAMKATTLSFPEQMAFARASLALRYDNPESAPIQADDLLQSRRQEDKKADLWTVFNKVQENLIQGGLPGRTTDNRRTRTRAVRSIPESTRLNKSLWILAEKMQELHHPTLEV